MFPGDQGVPATLPLEPGRLDEPARGGPPGGISEDAAAAPGVGGLAGFAPGDQLRHAGVDVPGPAGRARSNSASTTSQWGKFSSRDAR